MDSEKVTGTITTNNPHEKLFKPVESEISGTYLDLPEELARCLPFPTKSGEPPCRRAAVLWPPGSFLEV